MTDTPPATPILVNATPLREQIEAGLRQFILIAGPLMTFAASTGWGEKIGLGGIWSGFIGATGMIATIAAIVIGQWKTRTSSQKLTIVAAAAPNSVAQVKT